jgi:uncharacterized membrane protein
VALPTSTTQFRYRNESDCRFDFWYHQRQMQRLLRQRGAPVSFACALVVSLVIIISLGLSVAAQKNKPARKATARSQLRKQSPYVQHREAELQLERLPPDPSVESADVSITANVKARSLVFEAVPNPKVEFFGQPERDTTWEATRENLPNAVEPGVTYRNIGVRLKITSVFRDIDRIVAEALGEVPLTDDDPTRAETAKTPVITQKTGPPPSQSTSSRPPLKERP